MANKCKNLGMLILFLGIISSCIIAFNLGREATVLGGWLMTIIVFGGSMFLVYVIYVALTALGEVLENQETIMESIAYISNNVDSEEEYESNGSWKCSCGRINTSYTGTCGCGNNKPI